MRQEAGICSSDTTVKIVDGIHGKELHGRWYALTSNKGRDIGGTSIQHLVQRFFKVTHFVEGDQSQSADGWKRDLGQFETRVRYVVRPDQRGTC